MKNCVTAAADKICGKQISNKKQDWMITEILDKMREEKQLKKVRKSTEKCIGRYKRRVEKQKTTITMTSAAELEDLDRKHNP